MIKLRSACKTILRVGIGSLGLLALATAIDFHTPPQNPAVIVGSVKRQEVVDRAGRPLASTFENDWNSFEQLRLEEVPSFLRVAFVVSEDKRFFDHAGVDWRARIQALRQALVARRWVRGASTISEQVVRLMHPRSRNLWARWMETWESYALEGHWNKDEILEFYLNQMTYGGRRRGVVEAARYYFGRDLDTLDSSEMLALVVLVRAPGFLDPRKNPAGLKSRLLDLASRLQLDARSRDALDHYSQRGFDLSGEWKLPVEAEHFSSFARSRARADTSTLVTTLDSELQFFAQQLLDSQIAKLHDAKVRHGGLLVADVHRGEVLAWAVSGRDDRSGAKTRFDTLLVPRQPGSALKPFLYALALKQGATAAQIIVDEPMHTAVGQGLHAIRNYSRINYGPVTLRQALGNSLNIPAIKTAASVGVPEFLDFLKTAGISTLNREPDFYGEGLALGNGEVTLFELAQAYTLFANGGRVKSLKVLKEESSEVGANLVDPAVASLVTNILADPLARQMEFGRHSILSLPVPTAVKTGTATDYRDAWTLGFNAKYLVGVWMGHLDRLPTEGNTGAKAPALVFRGIMNFLNRRDDWKIPALVLDETLIPVNLCFEEGKLSKAHPGCESFTEYFVPGTEDSWRSQDDLYSKVPRLLQPVRNLALAVDPRIPRASQVFDFRMGDLASGDRVDWILNGRAIGSEVAAGNQLERPWTLEKGKHVFQARVHRSGQVIVDTGAVEFFVK